MNNTKIATLPNKGKGVLAVQDLTISHKIYGVSNLALSAISTSQVGEFCYHCYAGSKYNEKWYSIGQYRDADLKVCTGCKVARFCGKHCQTLAWKAYHKHECKIFAGMYPKILPESARAVIRFALQHKHGLLPDGAWPAILRLMSHFKEIQDAEGSVFMDLMLTAKAASEYSKASDQTTFFLLLCVLKTNAITLQTTCNDPIGVLLDPFLATINHSCEPNVAIHRPTYTSSTGWLQRKQTGQVALEVVPLRPISKDEELTLPYIDFQEHVTKRQSSLLQNYFFKCTCPKCTSDLEADTTLMTTNPSFAATLSTWRNEADAIFTSLSSPPFSNARLRKATTTLESLAHSIESHPSFHPSHDPYNRIIHELKILYTSAPESDPTTPTNNLLQKRMDLALICALKQHFITGPELYSTSQIHPTRIVNAIYLLQLLALFAEEHNSSTQRADTNDNNNSNGGLPVLLQQKKFLGEKGLTSEGVRYWRLQICMEMRAALQESVARDLVEVFEMEMVSVGVGDQSDAKKILGDVTLKKRAEEMIRQVVGWDGERWEDVKRSREGSGS